MNTNRHCDRPPEQRLAQDGTVLCRWCGGQLPRRKRSWCSKACVDDYLIRRSPSVARGHVKLRDKGVCAGCGMDTAAIRAQIRELRDHRAQRFVAALFIGARAPQWRESGAWWQADHVVPVVEGGGGCGLDNLRTLCTLCHVAETTALARRRAQMRRDATDPAQQKLGFA